MRRLVSGFVAAALLMAAPTLALADGAGSAKGVSPSADAARGGQTRTLVVGSDIFIGDRVNTGSTGQVQILFADNTELVVGPRSSLEINDYLIRSNGGPGKFVVDMLSGTFRFATGDAPKNKYVINTPTGTIGVRGTGFDLFVGNGTTRGIMYVGGTRSCAASGQCVVATGFCTLFEFSKTKATILGDTRKIGGQAHRQLRAQFIYAVNQSHLLRRFWMPRALECLTATPAPPPPQSEMDLPFPPGEPPSKPPPTRTPTPPPPPPVIF